MQASPVKLLGLLGDTKTVFKIPVYQRKYEWNEEHLEQFFKDIDRIIESGFEKNHFLGTVVYVQNELPGLMKERLVIDGQQRITTTLILLKALMDIFKDMKGSNINPKEIKETYLINPYGKDDTKYKLRPVDTDRVPYENLMLDNTSDSRVYSNYLISLDKIKSSKYSPEDIYKALGYINIVYISLDHSENPQIIFESLNSTGLSLTQADLIRNYILMGLEYKEQTELYNNYWKKIEKILTNNVISDFVRDFLTMKEGIVSNKNKVYDAFKQYHYNSRYESREILEELLKYSRYYSMISKGNTGLEEVDQELFYINNLRNSVSYPYILRVFNDFYETGLISKEALTNILKLIVSYIYRRNICNIATNALNRIFAVMPKEVDDRIENGLDYLAAVEDYLMSRSGTGIFPRNEEFRQQFLNNQIYSKNASVVKTILYTIEKNIHKETVNIDKLTIEHIMPQTLTDEWNIEIGRNAHEIHRVYKDTIGNLTLTNYNSEISNRGFREKRAFYKDSNIKITRDIKNFNTWTEDEILERAENLFNVIENIWAIPNDNYKGVTVDRLLPHEEYSIKDNILVTGHRPKLIIIKNKKYSTESWTHMLILVCKYLYNEDRDLLLSLKENTIFSRMLSNSDDDLRSGRKIADNLYTETNYGAKDILSYIVLLFEEYDMADQVYFEIK